MTLGRILMNRFVLTLVLLIQVGFTSFTIYAYEGNVLATIIGVAWMALIANLYGRICEMKRCPNGWRTHDRSYE